MVQTFFIHPTTFRGLDVGWNAPWDDTDIANITDTWPMRHQASRRRIVSYLAFGQKTRGCGPDTQFKDKKWLPDTLLGNS